MTIVNFSFMEEFVELAYEVGIIIDGRNIIYDGILIENHSLTALYDPNTRDININLKAFDYKQLFDLSYNTLHESIINNMSMSVQHEYLHDCIRDLNGVRMHSVKAEEQIVSYMLNFDYELDNIYK